MALVTRTGHPEAIRPYETTIGPARPAGERLEDGDVCYFDADGTVRRSNGTSAGVDAARADGIFVGGPANTGDPVRLARNVEVIYGSGLTPGSLYVATTAGRLDDAATTGGTAPVAVALDDSRIFFHGSSY